MTSTMTLNRVQSDGDLSRIDKKKTFRTFDGSQMFQTKDLLSNIMTALGSMQLTNDDVQSDSQVWSSEKSGSRQSMAQSDDSRTDRPTRKRAFSDFYIPQQDLNEDSTWNNGNDDNRLQDYLKNKTRQFSIASLFQTKSESVNRSDRSGTTTTNAVHVPVEGLNRSFMSKINPFKARVLSQEGKRHSVSSVDPRNYLQSTAKGRESRFSLSQSAAENVELLETTTIADLIRAIEEVQTKTNFSAETPLLADFRGSTKTKTKRHNLQTSTNGSRRGSLRPVPAYSTVFTSKNVDRPNNSSVLDRDSASTVHMTTPKSTKRNLLKAPNSSPPPQILQRTFSLRPSPLATSSHSASNTRAPSETPTFTIQSPDDTKKNVLWLTDRSVHELKTKSTRKRSDSK